MAILKFKMAAEDALEKNGSNSGFVLKGIWKVKSIGSTSIANFALDYITPCTISGPPVFDAMVCLHPMFGTRIHVEAWFGNLMTSSLS